MEQNVHYVQINIVQNVEYQMEFVQNVINSITYNGLVAPGAETEAE